MQHLDKIKLRFTLPGKLYSFTGKSFISFILISMYSLCLHAQGYAVQGNIKDSVTAIPLEDASIALYKAIDSSLLTGTLTKKDGAFVFNKVKQGSYYIIVKFIGYESRTVSNI